VVGTACGTNELFLIGDQPVCIEPLCINPDFNADSRLVRYLVASFTNSSANNGNIVARSFVRDSITANRTGPTTIISFTGWVYNINIPSGEDIQHITIFDKAGGPGQTTFRIIFTWSDTDFVGNILSTNVTAVAPNTTVSVYVDSGGSPLLNSSNGVIRVSGISSNEYRIYGFTGRSITVDFQLQDGSSTWYCVSCNF
jgi:hypothetical protein